MKKQFALLVLAITFVGQAFASGYPADYNFYSDNRQAGPAYVRRDLQGGGRVALNISYRGVLSNSERVSVFIRVHYNAGVRTGRFLMARTRSGFETRITNGCLEGQFGGCRKQSTQEMKDLLYWGGRGPMTLNGIKFELAFVDENGNWDSQYGQNYQFQFDEYKMF